MTLPGPWFGVVSWSRDDTPKMRTEDGVLLGMFLTREEALECKRHYTEDGTAAAILVRIEDDEEPMTTLEAQSICDRQFGWCECVLENDGVCEIWALTAEEYLDGEGDRIVRDRLLGAGPTWELAIEDADCRKKDRR